MISISCRNNGVTKEFQEGITLQEALKHFEFDQPYRIVSAKVNNVSQGLRFRVYNNRNVEFIDIHEERSMRVYDRY